MSKIGLNSLYVCDNIIVGFDGRPSIINLFSEMTVDGLPAINPIFNILVTTQGEAGVYEEIIEIVDPTGKTIASTKGNVEMKNNGTNNFVAKFINTKFEIEGNYWIKVSINGEVLTNKINHLIAIKKK